MCLVCVWLAEPVEESTAPAVPASISDRYTVGRMIGDGNFAVVHECVELSTSRAYALKIINKGKCRGKVSRAKWKSLFTLLTDVLHWSPNHKETCTILQAPSQDIFLWSCHHDAVTELPSWQLLSYVPFISDLLQSCGSSFNTGLFCSLPSPRSKWSRTRWLFCGEWNIQTLCCWLRRWTLTVSSTLSWSLSRCAHNI